MTFLESRQTTNLIYDRAKPERVELVLPVSVLEDTDEHTMVSISAGTAIQAGLLTDGSKPPRNIPYRELAALDRVLGKTTWVNTNVVFIWKPEWHWDVRLYWSAESNQFIGWYINIQNCMRRADEGFVTTDHFIDIQVQPDRNRAFKDEEELSDAVNLGLYTASEHNLIRSWAHAASQLIENRLWPFDVSPSSFGMTSK